MPAADSTSSHSATKGKSLRFCSARVSACAWSSASISRMSAMGHILESHRGGHPYTFHVPARAVPVLFDVDFRDVRAHRLAALVYPTFVVIDRFAIQGQDLVGLFLDFAGIGHIAHAWALIGALFDLPTHLTKGEYRNIQI